MMLPFLALVFMTMDAGWAIFVKATLQHAVREGVRYGVTGQTCSSIPAVSGCGASTSGSQGSSIEAVTVSQSMGLLSASQVSVQYLDPVSLAPTSPPNNAGGNIVQVSVTGYVIAPLAPLLRSGTGIPVNVTAADVIEGSPGGVAPTP
jgi:Flp pilus assembly protein TadG